MTSAGVGVAVHLDGFTAAGLASHRALVAAGMTSVDVAVVFAGIRHDEDEYSGVLRAVRRTIPPRWTDPTSRGTAGSDTSNCLSSPVPQ